MTIATEAIVLKQVKTATDSRILTLFTKKLGKVSAASHQSFKQKGKYAASINPFTFGKYFLYKGKDIYNINSTDATKAYFKVGEEIDKFACCSYILEYTDRILPEGQPAPYMFELLVDFFEIMESRKKDYMFLVLVYEIKSLIYTGILPQLDKCDTCDAVETEYIFSIADGSVYCSKCQPSDSLIYKIDSSIINIIVYILNQPIKKLSRLSIEEDKMAKISKIIKAYLNYHLEMENMKSISFLSSL